MMTFDATQAQVIVCILDIDKYPRRCKLEGGAKSALVDFYLRDIGVFSHRYELVQLQ